MPKNRTKNSPRPVVEEPYIKDFLDMVAPSVIDFKVDHYLVRQHLPLCMGAAGVPHFYR